MQKTASLWGQAGKWALKGWRGLKTVGKKTWNSGDAHLQTIHDSAKVNRAAKAGGMKRTKFWTSGADKVNATGYSSGMAKAVSEPIVKGAPGKPAGLIRGLLDPRVGIGALKSKVKAYQHFKTQANGSVWGGVKGFVKNDLGSMHTQVDGAKVWAPSQAGRVARFVGTTAGGAALWAGSGIASGKDAKDKTKAGISGVAWGVAPTLMGSASIAKGAFDFGKNKLTKPKPMFNNNNFNS